MKVVAPNVCDRFNPRLSHTKNSKMVLDVTLLNTQHYKVPIKSKVK